MTDTVLIVGRSPVARVVLPRLLAPLECAIICTDDALCAAHVLERLRTDFIVVDADLGRIDCAAFATLVARLPQPARISLHILRAGGGDVPVDDLLARCTTAWRRDDVGGADLRQILPALLSCLARAAPH